MYNTVADLVVTATSDKQDTIADADIQITGTGANRTITVTPMATGGGNAVITVTVTDPTRLSASVQYTVHVTSAPHVEGVQDMYIDFTQPTPMATLSVQVIDPDLPILKGLQFKADISDTSIIPTAGVNIIQFTVIGGPTQLQIIPAAIGTCNITLTLTDVDGHAATSAFTVTVGNGQEAPAS